MWKAQKADSQSDTLASYCFQLHSWDVYSQTNKQLREENVSLRDSEWLVSIRETAACLAGLL